MNEIVFTSAWGAVKSVLLLIVAFIAASIAKSLVVKLINKTKIEKLFGKSPNSFESKNTMVTFAGKLTQLLVFLLFVPGIFEAWGMGSISFPILNLLDTMWGYLPNIVAAVVVMGAGLFAAGLVRELLVPVFGKIKIDVLQEKAGIEVSDEGKLSNTLAYIIYVIIIIPVIITALNVLGIQAISGPAVKMLDVIFAYIPSIFAALIIIVIGCMIAKFSGKIVEHMVAAAGLDAEISKQLDGKAKNFVFSKAAGMIVNVVMVVFFTVEGFNLLQLKVITNIGNAVIGYMPYVLTAVLLMLACYVCGSIAHKVLKENGSPAGAVIAKAAIYVLGGFMILSELGVAEVIVNTAFILMMAAVAIAFAISFGIGGREFAARMLEKMENKFFNE